MGIQDSHSATHSHVFLGEGHETNERRTWFVIWLCGLMMVGEIIGGMLFGSIALVADGLHMSTHASALLLAALAYRYARRHADDPRFTFGTGKLGDLAGYTSAIVLAMIALLSGGGHHHHGHGHGHDHDDGHAHDDDAQRIETAAGPVALEIFEHGVPP